MIDLGELRQYSCASEKKTVSQSKEAVIHFLNGLFLVLIPMCKIVLSPFQSN